MNKLLLLFEFLKRRYLIKFKTRKGLEKYQKRKLAKQLKYFKKNSPYFKEYGFSKNLKMNKSFMMENFNKLNTVNVKKEEAIKIALESERTRDFSKKYRDVSVGLSSGTSGHRGIFLTTKKEQAKWAGAVFAKLLPRYRPIPQKIAFFLRSDNDLYNSSNFKLLQYKYFDIEQSIGESVNILNEYKPSFLVAPVSMLLLLAKEIEENRLKINPKKVISVAEILEDEDEKYLKRVWKQKYIHQVYQATEGFLACTCRYGRLHLNEDLIMFRKRYISKDRFYPIITDLERTSQPMINYELNDILIEENTSCPCGSIFTIIKKIEGRADDIFYFKNTKGEAVSIFPDLIRRCVLFVEGIREYQIVQGEDGSISILADALTYEQRSMLINEFEILSKKYGFILPKINFEPYIIDRSVKLKRVVSKKNLSFRGENNESFKN